jgi:hypothetical protein
VIEFPPYGQFARVYAESVDPASLAPSAWRPELPNPDREKSFLEWRDETVRLINETLWPSWDEAGLKWVDANFDRMKELTEADFRGFEPLLAEGALDKRPSTPVSAASIPTHRQYFLDEDTAKLGERYFFYDTTLPSTELDLFLSDLRDTLRQKAGSISIQIKTIVQRPRAYQVAKLMGRTHHFELAATSMTSSMSSGHCFQGCLAVAGIYAAWLQRGYAPSGEQLVALGQFGVDIGDRRVFAGVHYPSDNLSSWIMDLRLVDEVCPDRRVGRFLAQAIVGQSRVFALLKESREAVYGDAIQLIEALATAS